MRGTWYNPLKRKSEVSLPRLFAQPPALLAGFQSHIFTARLLSEPRPGTRCGRRAACSQWDTETARARAEGLLVLPEKCVQEHILSDSLGLDKYTDPWALA